MKSFDFKSLAIIEIVILFAIGLFSLDLLPRNYSEFYGICAQTWPKDPKQYQICLEPYYREATTSKYAIGFSVALLILLPVVFVF